jgi:cytochrome b involved in lipid metabolism
MDYIFGHYTYWRLLDGSSAIKKEQFPTLKRKKSSERLFDKLDDDMISWALNYLTVREALVMNYVSKKCYCLINHPQIWLRFEKEIFKNYWPNNWISIDDNRQNIKKRFFTRVTAYPHHLLKDRQNLILIDKNIYDITNFIGQHPGGELILREYLVSKLDARKPYDLACHSKYARALAEKMCIWNPKNLLGYD